jgi:phage terminase large subunit-like protein
MSEKLWQYVEDVSKHKIITCKTVQLAVKRFANDIKRTKNDPSFE